MSGIFWNVFSVCYMPSFVIFGKYSGLFPQDSCSFSLHIVMCYLVVKSFVLKNLIHGTEHDTVQYICKPPYVCNNFGHWCVSTKYDFHNCDSNISGKISDKTFPVLEWKHRNVVKLKQNAQEAGESEKPSFIVVPCLWAAWECFKVECSIFFSHQRK